MAAPQDIAPLASYGFKTMMPTIPELYYNDKQDDAVWSSKAQGIFHVNRMAQGLPCWRTGSFKSIFKQKKLILAPLSIRYWEVEKIYTFKQLLRQLLEEGFEIFFFKDEVSLNQINKEELDFLNFGILRNLSKEPPIGQDLHILNEYWADILLYGTTKPAIHLSKFVSINSIRNLSAWKYMQPAPEQVTIDSFYKDVVKNLSKIQVNFPDLPIVIEYKEAQLNEEQIQKLLEGNEIIVETLRFTPSDLAQIKTLTILGDINALTLQKVFKKIQNLQSLTLGEIRANEARDKIKGHFSEPLHLEYLRSLRVISSSAHAQNIQDLLQATNELMHIEFSYSEVTGTFTEELNLKNLRTATFNDTQILDLKSIISKAEHLNTLEILFPAKEADCRFEQSFPDLHTFNAEFLDAGDLECNLSRMPNLKCLKLRDYLATPFRESFAFPHLKKLKINASDIPAGNLAKILEKSHNLAELSLKSCFLKDIAPEITLPYLREIDLSGTKISLPDLQRFLASKRPLSLSMRDVSDEIVELVDWRDLHKLKMTGSINALVLQKILAKAVTLKTLHLPQILYETIDGSDFYPNIEHLELRYNSKVSANNIKKLLERLPNCKSVNLNYNRLEIDEELSALLKNKNVYGGLTPRKAAANGKKSVDADTHFDPNKELNARQMFFPLNGPPIPVSQYRLSAYDTVKINPASCSKNQAFLMVNTKPIDLVKHSIIKTNNIMEIAHSLRKKSKNISHYFGRTVMHVTPDWQAIPSLFANEKLTHYQCNPANADLGILYSQRDSMYYIRSNSPQTVSFDFLLERKVKPSMKLPRKIANLVQKFSKFGEGSLELKEMSNPSGEDYLQAILQQEKGACRHRALAFQALMERKFPGFPVRSISNDCHSFAEVFYKNEWITCDLGGYSAQLKISEAINPLQEMAKPSQKQSQEIEKLEKEYERALETWVRHQPQAFSVLGYCQNVTAKDHVKKKLIELSGKQEIQDLKLSLQDYCERTKRPYFIINSAEDLVCKAPFIENQEGSNQGYLKEGPGGAFHQFLKNQHGSNNHPVILINISALDSDDMIRFNTLFDKKGFADGTPLPQNTSIIGLVNTKKPDFYQGSDLYSRFNHKEICPLPSAELAAHREKIAALPIIDKENRQTETINLFSSFDWKERLLGHWQIRRTDLIGWKEN